MSYTKNLNCANQKDNLNNGIYYLKDRFNKRFYMNELIFEIHQAQLIKPGPR